MYKYSFGMDRDSSIIFSDFYSADQRCFYSADHRLDTLHGPQNRYWHRPPCRSVACVCLRRVSSLLSR
jgi:hypothetical protein